MANATSSNNANDKMHIAMRLVSDLAVQISQVLSSLATVRTFYNEDVPVLRWMIADYERIVVTLDINLETLSETAQVDTAKTSAELDILLQTTDGNFEQIIIDENIQRSLISQIDNRYY
ncbi:hypothetical protein PR048_012716 [Dryococelus australis]|uniref:Uncharacterized protein n=1 Tax=Dryococelus australis TaxID=614101 RepID=A0ABQ9HQE5_9NEOP|nr:hypothetical protein PR048_012716 [Dryococelus australis]